MTIDEIEAVLEVLRQEQALYVHPDGGPESDWDPPIVAGVSQAIEIIESLLGDTARMQTLLIGIHQAIAALYEAPASDVAP